MNVPIDTKYYLDNLLAKPLYSIFEHVLGEKFVGLVADALARVRSLDVIWHQACVLIHSTVLRDADAVKVEVRL